MDKFQVAKALRVNLTKENKITHELLDSRRKTDFALKKSKEPDEGDEI